MHQLESSLLQQLQDSSRHSHSQAEEVGAKLDALLMPELLAAVSSAQPPAGSSSSSASVLLEELAGSNQVRTRGVGVWALGVSLRLGLAVIRGAVRGGCGLELAGSNEVPDGVLGSGFGAQGHLCWVQQ